MRKNFKKIFFVLSAIILVSSLVACANLIGLDKSDSAKIQGISLFKRIGGLPVLTQIVDEAIDEIANSPKTKRTFDGIKLKPLKESVVAQLCMLTGGDCVYEGETMLNAHQDAKISEAEFEAFVAIFRSKMTKYLATREKNELLKILAPMKRDIVTPL